MIGASPVSVTPVANLPPVSTTPAVNLPPVPLVSLKPVANLRRCQLHLWQIATGINNTGGKFVTGVYDTGGK
jgi:hypothetical protein